MGKKIQFISFIIFSIFLISTANAQIKLGFSGGINKSRFSYKKKVINGSIIHHQGIIIGGVFEYNINKTFAIKFSPSYSQRGSDVKVLKNITSTVNEYIELPFKFLGKFQTGLVKPYFFGGISFGFLINSETEDENTKHLFKTTNVSLLYGIGLEIKLDSRTAFFIESEYHTGIIDVAKGLTHINIKGFDFKTGILFNI